MAGRSAADDLQELERRIGYSFKDRSALERAITHRSWAHEHVRPGEAEKARNLHNEALEFIGDSVLGLVIADNLFRAHPDLTEGELSRMKHRLVSAATLARAAISLNLGEFLRFGRGEEKTGGRRKQALLADAFEAILGAIYIDGGFSAASDFVLRVLGAELAKADPEKAAAADYKTMLQELLQSRQQPTPQYNVIETSGPPHRRRFRVEVVWNGGRAEGEGRSIKAAEMDAARHALALLNAQQRQPTHEPV